MTQMHTHHPKKAAAFVSDQARTTWHNKALWFVRQKRDKAAASLPEWEQLRDTAAQIKAHSLSNLDEYLEEFERNAQAKGITIHWAATGDEHNQIVYDILKTHQVREVVKSKSMLTEECHLNPFLEKRGITVIDTDLGERIVQLRNEPPSHIVLPAIHVKKEEIGELFHEHMGTKKGASDPKYLTESARLDLRKKFLDAEAGITGVNFAVAETGSVVVCTNEGNADLGTVLPPIHIACMGLEKIIPKQENLGVFLRLLARSATGQPITTYSSHFNGPQKGSEMHVVIVDNGRSELLSRKKFWRSLSCIRCGACMNTCPIYRRSGGHSYGYVIPGPIGSVLAPNKDLAAHKSLPFASTLCGSCTDVCPVKIDLHHQLLAWREEVVKAGKLNPGKRLAMKLTSWVLQSPQRYKLAGKCARLAMKLPRVFLYNPLNIWGRQRDLPPAPPESFQEWYTKNRDKNS